jgi:nickel-dependent lactate racemase
MAGDAGVSTCVPLQFDSYATELVLPRGADILRVRQAEPLADVPRAVAEALLTPIGCPPLADLCREALERMASVDRAAPPSVVVVVSDHSRPVPYRGGSGILWPLLVSLLNAGASAEWITLLVATGTHHVLADSDIWALFDPRVRETGVRVSSHDAADPDRLVPLGTSRGGVEVAVNRTYAEADLRILTGLVEPHFMAGASGGRKSICPGLLDVQSVRDFHGPAVVASDGIGDLCLEGNPCHEHSLEIASLAPADFILNVTTRADGRVTGVFAGDMVQAHEAAVEHLRDFAEVPLEEPYDIVVSHAARVGINHYQASKAICSAASAVRQGGHLVLIADSTDSDPVGSQSYRRLLALLSEEGPAAFEARLLADDWTFAQDQWAVQSLARLLKAVPPEHLFYFSPQTALVDYSLLPCRHPAAVLSEVFGAPRGSVGSGSAGEMVGRFVRAAVDRAVKESREKSGREPRIACLADGPHCVPRVSGTCSEGSTG